MADINRRFVGHDGDTDVISFVYPGEDIAVELFICMDVAAREGAERNDSSYSAEMVLYLVHGILHAAGEDDLDPAPRRRMRRREAELIRELRREFDFSGIFPPREN